MRSEKYYTGTFPVRAYVFGSAGAELASPLVKVANVSTVEAAFVYVCACRNLSTKSSTIPRDAQSTQNSGVFGIAKEIKV